MCFSFGHVAQCRLPEQVQVQVKLRQRRIWQISGPQNQFRVSGFKFRVALEDSSRNAHPKLGTRNLKLTCCTTPRSAAHSPAAEFLHAWAETAHDPCSYRDRSPAT